MLLEASMHGQRARKNLVTFIPRMSLVKVKFLSVGKDYASFLFCSITAAVLPVYRSTAPCVTRLLPDHRYVAREIEALESSGIVEKSKEFSI